MKNTNIRNFSIIAHIDHGKSTLADRLMEFTKTISDREKQDQLLDNMELEKEKGITIKSRPVTMIYNDTSEIFQLNLIDTPGHVDFSYEVSRSLSACEGALLVLDASQGVQAQTIANLKLAMANNLLIIPIINKIDLPAANIEHCYNQLEEILAIPKEDSILASAKTGEGIKEIIQAIIERIPAPTTKQQEDKVLKALILDSEYDSYRGVINYIRLFSGIISKDSNIELYHTKKSYEVKEVGVFTPKMKEVEYLKSGEVGYVIANIKNIQDAKIGDTIYLKNNIPKSILPGFEETKSMVFSGIYPIDNDEYKNLKLGIEKLNLNDPAFSYQPETSPALGFGFRCGFLGLLHMEIIQERLKREYDLDIISTYPSVVYNVVLKNGKTKKIDNPILLPDPTQIDYIQEPIIEAEILFPNQYLGGIMNLILEKRGICLDTKSIDNNNLLINTELPMHEIVIDFNDRLKNISKGYASMSYENKGYRTASLSKLEILVNYEKIDAFSSIVHIDNATDKAKNIVSNLKEVIPRQMFSVPIQGAIGNNILARETIPAMKKNVIAKCYGGDISRKRKLIEKQKKGKKRMKKIGKVNIPQEAFLKVLKS